MNPRNRGVQSRFIRKVGLKEFRMRTRWLVQVEHRNPWAPKFGELFQQRRAHTTGATGHDDMLTFVIHSRHGCSSFPCSTASGPLVSGRLGTLGANWKVALAE